MKTLAIALAVVTSASLCAAQSSAKNPNALTKRELAHYTPPVTLQLPPSPTNGSDDCMNAAANDAISGIGTFPVDTTIATDGATPAPSCQTVHKDVWFQYTATGTGIITVSACGSTTSDTVLAVWSGAGCPTGTSLACNDDSCGLVSSVSFNATTGNVYMIQCGMYGATLGTTWAITTSLYIPPPPPTNDDCGMAITLPGPGTYAYDATTATTGSDGQANSNCLFFATTAIAKDLWYTYNATTNGTATVSTCGLLVSTNFDTKIAVYSGAGCPGANMAIACQDDAGAICSSQSTLETVLSWPTICGQSYTIQLGQYPNNTIDIFGSFAVSEVGAACAPPGTPFCFGDGSGTACPCANAGATGNGCASSVNASGANLSGSGSASIANDTFVLNGTGMPSSSALYFQGTAQTAAGAGAAFGDGLRCAGGTVIRLGTKTNVAGTSSFPSGGDPSIHVKGATSAGNVRDYQCWYRNAAAFCTPSTFNLTNGLEMTWAP